MSKVITFSTSFPSYHSKAGQPTFFAEKLYNSIFEKEGDWSSAPGTPTSYVAHLNYLINDKKHHTIRKGQRFKEGDYFSPRIWGTDINPKSRRSGPYHSKQIILAPDTLVTKVFLFAISNNKFFIDNRSISPDTLEEVALNDGLERHDLQEWFKYPKDFYGQIICWNENIKY